MTVGIVGLGLIGGSMAKAYHAKGHRVLAFDTDTSVLEFARVCGAVDGELDAQTISQCDIVLLAVYPRAAVQWLRDAACSIGKNTLIMDCCGTKQLVCRECFAIAARHGFVFVGGHPMAGTHNSGFKYACADLFEGAPMVIVPPDFNNIELLERVKQLLAPLGFGFISVTTAQKHDQMIAFTSQMAHVVSNAYIKSPTAGSHKGFSAGSYKDMTRVAWLNPQMWAELFLENKEFLLQEMEILLDNLQRYKEALQQEDRAALEGLLEEGRRRKQEVDG